ncbi:MAG: sigma-70 factor domain-containing protein, partial [Candidatus Woesearchaeota archaeon]
MYDAYKEDINKIKKKAKKKGHVYEGDVDLRFIKYDLNAKEVEEIKQWLKEKEDIKIVQYQDELQKNGHSYDDISQSASVSDPVKMYFKDMGQEGLLTKEDEIELAKKAKEGDPF